MAHVADVAIQSSQVAADQTDFPFLVDLSDLPASFWDVVANGGGDIRVFKSDGTTELPREVVSCDTATDTGELWVKFSGVLSGSANTTIQIHADGSSSEPAFTDPVRGRNSVWSDYEVVWHGNGVTNSTGKANGVVSGATSGSTGQIGSAYSFDATNDRIDFSTSAITGEPITISAWGQANSVTGDDDALASYANSGSSSQQFRLMLYNEAGSGDSRAVASAFDGVLEDIESTAPLLTDTSSWGLAHAVWASDTDVRAYANGGNKGTGAVNLNITGMDRFSVGVTADSTPTGFWDGRLDEARLRGSVLSDWWITTEYNNQSSPSTFYTVTEAGGGGTTIDADAGSFSLTGGEVLLTVQRQLSGNPGTFSFTGSDVTLTYAPVASFQLDADPGVFTFTGGEVLLTVQRALQADAGSYTLTGSDVELSTGLAFTANSGTFSLTGGDVTFSRGYALSLEPGEFTITGSTVNLSYSGEARVHTINGILITGASVNGI